jgi:hypothetical protein
MEMVSFRTLEKGLVLTASRSLQSDESFNSTKRLAEICVRHHIAKLSIQKMMPVASLSCQV